MGVSEERSLRICILTTLTNINQKNTNSLEPKSVCSRCGFANKAFTHPSPYSLFLTALYGCPNPFLW